MSDPLSRIKSEILAERKQTGKIDREAWLTRHPEMAETLPAVFRLIDRVVEAEALEPTAAWSDYQGIATRARENLRRIAQVRGADREETALGEALARVYAEGGFLAKNDVVAADRALLPAFTLGYIVRALVRAKARLHQFMGQKLAYLGQAGLGFTAFPDFAPYTHGMFGKSVYAAEKEAERRGWFDVISKGYRPATDMERALTELVPHIIRAPEVAERYLSHLASRTNDELEIWGMTHHAAIRLYLDRRRVTVLAVREFFLQTEHWKEKVTGGRIQDSQIESALEHLLRLQLARPEWIDFVS